MGWWRTKLDFWVPLVSEKNSEGEYKRASLGRIAFWVTFLMAIWCWIFSPYGLLIDIHASHMQMLYITATYNLMKKTTWFGSIKGNETEMTFESPADNKKPVEDDTPPRI